MAFLIYSFPGQHDFRVCLTYKAALEWVHSLQKVLPHLAGYNGPVNLHAIEVFKAEAIDGGKISAIEVYTAIYEGVPYETPRQGYVCRLADNPSEDITVWNVSRRLAEAHLEAWPSNHSAFEDAVNVYRKKEIIRLDAPPIYTPPSGNFKYPLLHSV